MTTLTTLTTLTSNSLGTTSQAIDSQAQFVSDILAFLKRTGQPILIDVVVNRLHNERGYDKVRIHQAILKLLRDGVLFIARRDQWGNEYIWLILMIIINHG